MDGKFNKRQYELYKVTYITIKRISNIMIVFDLICLQTGWYKLQ